MRLLTRLLGLKKKAQQKTFAEYQRELLIKQGREQFQRLVEKNLTVPVALL